MNVVVDDDAQPVGPVQQGEDQQQPIERLPPHVVPALGHECEVDPLYAASHQVHDVEVYQHQEQQH